jgi:hypothetical protein
MEGAPFEAVRAAVLRLVESALAEDRVVLRFFTAGLEAEQTVKPRGSSSAGSAEAARNLLAARIPGGTTHIARSLHQLAGERAGRAEECLVLLLTDGQERGEPGDPLAAARSARARLDALGVDLRPIGLGTHSAASFLTALCKAGEEPVWATDLAQLATLFLRAARADDLAEGPALALREVESEEGTLAWQVLGPGAPVALPALERHVRAALASGAEALWIAERGEPVLALQRVGRGRVAAFASLPEPGWARQWSGGRGFPGGFGPILRWLARASETAQRPSAHIEQRGSAAFLVLSELPPETPVALPARLVDLGEAGGARALERVVLGPPTLAPGRDPERQRELDLGALRAQILSARLPGLAVGAGAAEQVLSIDPASLRALAEQRSSVDWAELRVGSGSVWRGARAATRGLALGLLGAGLLVLLAAELLRRGADQAPPPSSR